MFLIILLQYSLEIKNKDINDYYSNLFCDFLK